MARTAMTMTGGVRLAEHLSVGVLAGAYPYEQVEEALRQTNRGSQRVRDLPAEVVTYYVMALGLLMAVSTVEVMRVLSEGLGWLEPGRDKRIVSKVALSKARQRLGAAPLRWLWGQCQPLAQAGTKGAFYKGRRLVAIDGSVLDVPDTAANRESFDKPGANRGQSAFPQVRLVGLVETGTHAFFAAATGPCSRGEQTLASQVIPQLNQGMLCLADRLFAVFPQWSQAVATGAALLWRARASLVLPVEQPLADGSYLSTFYGSTKDRRHRRNGLAVRVIEYRLENHPDEPAYRLLTNLLDPEQAPASELAALYPERWEIEGVFDELKTHLRGSRVVLRSKTPELIEQEIYGLLLAHHAVRSLMWRAARKSDLDPDWLSFTHAVGIVRRKLARPSRPAFCP
jgi:hypothetical protein